MYKEREGGNMQIQVKLIKNCFSMAENLRVILMLIYTRGKGDRYVRKIVVLHFYDCISLPNPSTMSRIRHKFNFKAEFRWFEFKVFLLLDWFLKQVKRSQSPLPITGGRIVGFNHFPSVLVLYEKQTSSSMI